MVSRVINDGYYICEGSTAIFNVINVISTTESHIEVVGVFINKDKNAYDIPQKYKFKRETIERWESIILK